MLPIVGTIKNTVKLAGLQQKWEQKKQNGAMAVKKDMDVEQRQLLMYQEDLKRMRESEHMASLGAKIKAGKELTTEELAYLKEKNPTAYQDYMEIKREKEAYEREIRNCKTKEDVQELKVTKLGHLAAQAKSVVNNPHIPKAKKLELLGKFMAKAANIHEVHTKFVQSAQYSNLPTEEEKMQKEQNEKEADVQQAPLQHSDETEESGQPATDAEESKQPINGHGDKAAQTSTQVEEAESTVERIEFDEVKQQLTQYIKQVEGMDKKQ